MNAARKWLRANWSRLVAGLALAVVAAVTGRISYIHIEALTLALHQQSPVPRLMPFGVDGLIVVGSVVLLQAPKGREWLGWLGVAPGVAASVFANVESGLRYGPLAAAWAGVPALFFALATFLLERWLKAQASPVAQVAQTGPPEPSERGRDGFQSPSVPAASIPGEPLTPDVALRALIGTGSRRDIAALLGVPKTRVDRWAAHFKETDDAVAQVAHDALENAGQECFPEAVPEPEPSLNGSGPHA